MKKLRWSTWIVGTIVAFVVFADYWIKSVRRYGQWCDVDSCHPRGLLRATLPAAVTFFILAMSGLSAWFMGVIRSWRSAA